MAAQGSPLSPPEGMRSSGVFPMTYDLDFTETARFWSKVKVLGNTQCWEWQAYRKAEGYGQYSVDGKMVGSHRISYALRHGSIPDGLHIDHLCRNPACVNPEHLEAVTIGENTRRGVATQRAAAMQRAKTHCRHGHEFTPSNTYLDRHGKRSCRTCQNSRKRDRRMANRHVSGGRVVFDGRKG